MGDVDLPELLTARYDETEKTAAGLQSMVATLNEINDRRPPDTRHGTQVYDAASWALARVLDDLAAARGVVDHCKTMAAHAVPESAMAQFCENILSRLATPEDL